MTSPRVTVLVAFFNDEAFIARSIESILGQTFPAFELLLINDGSTDRSREIAASFQDERIVLLDNETNIGLTKSLNRGLAAARGELIARLDSNDVAYPQRIAKQVSFLDCHPEVVAVGAQARFVRPNRKVVRRGALARPITPEGIDWSLMFYSPIIHPASMYRKSAASELGGYDERFTTAQDMDLWSRLATRGRLANLPETLIEMLVDPSSISGYRTSAKRWRMIGNVSRTMANNIRRLTQQDVLPEAWPELWVRLLYGDPELPPEDVLRVLDLLDETRMRFAWIRPETRRNREIADQVAFFCEHAAFEIAPRSKATACRAFVRAIKSSFRRSAPGIPRMLLRLLLGDAAVTLWRRMVYRASVPVRRRDIK